MAEDARDTPNIEEVARVIDAGNLKGDSDRRTQVDRAIDNVLVSMIQHSAKASEFGLQIWGQMQERLVTVGLQEATAERIAAGVSLPQTALDAAGVQAAITKGFAESIRSLIELLRSPTPTPPPTAAGTV